MPEVFRNRGFVFFFYSNESQEPMHIHVRKAGGYAKFWLEPIELDSSKGLSTQDLNTAEGMIKEKIDIIREKWDATFRNR